MEWIMEMISFSFGFTLHKAEQLQGMELQEEKNEDERDIRKLIKKAIR